MKMKYWTRTLAFYAASEGFPILVSEQLNTDYMARGIHQQLMQALRYLVYICMLQPIR